VISAVHNAGYVFGDFNPRNIGVDISSGKVAFLDTDSYHVFDKSKNRHYRCKVCADGYAAPELLEACANHKATNPNDSKELYEKTPLPTFTEKTDNFALAIHIFKLLMNGFTPFGGIIETVKPSRASPSQGNAAIRRNEYSFKPGYKPMSPAVPPLDIFPLEIADLFTRAFLVIGSVNPSQRPTSIEWHQALSRYENTLVDCKTNKLHQYDRKNKICPFCEADTRYQSSISGNKVSAFTTPPPVTLPQQKTYSQTQPSSGTYGGSSGNTLLSTLLRNWWDRLSQRVKTGIIAASIGVLILGFGVINGWFSGNNNAATQGQTITEQPTMQQPPSALLPTITGSVRIDGTAQVGQTLTVNTNNLGGSGTITYQWRRGNTNVGTSSPTYVLTTADVGSRITLTVTRSDNSGSVTSNPTPVVASAATPTPLPALTGTVSITSPGETVHVGQTITTNTVNLGGSGAITYQWRRGNTNVGTNSPTYVLIAADVGSNISVIVTRSGNSGSITSSPTGAVAPERIIEW
jgi:serine/threonine protein kinase